MIGRCANSACQAELGSLSAGDLYALERRSADTEFFWVCSACAPLMSLCLDPMGYASVRLRSEVVRPQPLLSEIWIRLVFSHKSQAAGTNRGNRFLGESLAAFEAA
jgi:hypothetical protein